MRQFAKCGSVFISDTENQHCTVNAWKSVENVVDAWCRK